MLCNPVFPSVEGVCLQAPQCICLHFQSTGVLWESPWGRDQQGLLAGTFGECSSEAEVQAWMRYNIFLLLEVGTFNALVELLNMEIE